MPSGDPLRPPFDISQLDVEEPREGVFMAYANVVNIGWTLDDVRIRFCELMNVSTDENPKFSEGVGVIQEKAAITLPWRQAKLLRDILNKLVSEFEDMNGEMKPLRLPKGS